MPQSDRVSVDTVDIRRGATGFSEAICTFRRSQTAQGWFSSMGAALYKVTAPSFAVMVSS